MPFFMSNHTNWKQGLSIGSATIDGEKHLVAFGGYNGKYNNEVYHIT